jgi:hypothetical protein
LVVRMVNVLALTKEEGLGCGYPPVPSEGLSGRVTAARAAASGVPLLERIDTGKPYVAGIDHCGRCIGGRGWRNDFAGKFRSRKHARGNGVSGTRGCCRRTDSPAGQGGGIHRPKKCVLRYAAPACPTLANPIRSQQRLGLFQHALDATDELGRANTIYDSMVYGQSESHNWANGNRVIVDRSDPHLNHPDG